MVTEITTELYGKSRHFLVAGPKDRIFATVPQQGFRAPPIS